VNATTAVAMRASTRASEARAMATKASARAKAAHEMKNRSNLVGGGTWIGDWKDGKFKDGLGVCISNEFRKRAGDFRNCSLNGLGEFRVFDNLVYAGEFKDGE